MDVNFAMHDMCIELYLLGRSLHLLAGACFLLCFDVVEMFNKRSLPDEALEDIPEEKRLRHDLLDVFLGNNLSAQRSARVFENANLAGAANVDDLAVNRKTRKSGSRSASQSFPEHEMASGIYLHCGFLQSCSAEEPNPGPSPCSSRMSWYTVF